MSTSLLATFLLTMTKHSRRNIKGRFVLIHGFKGTTNGSCGSLDGYYLYRQECKVPHILDQTAEDTGLEARLDYKCCALPLHTSLPIQHHQLEKNVQMKTLGGHFLSEHSLSGYCRSVLLHIVKSVIQTLGDPVGATMPNARIIQRPKFQKSHGDSHSPLAVSPYKIKKSQYLVSKNKHSNPKGQDLFSKEI